MSASEDELEAPEDQDRGARLQKVLAAAGLGSRRHCEELILEGRIEVDRRVVSELGARVDLARQEVRVDGEVLLSKRRVYFALHKPKGVLCTSRDPAGRPRATDMLPPEAGRVFTVGRLDMASEGLLLLTNDGELANRLTHPRYGVKKTYLVTVAGEMEDETLDRLRRGVHLAEGFARVEGARIKSRRKKSTLLEMILDEGKNREIRRVLARMGHKVQQLLRIAIGPLRLGELPSAAYRPLTPKEIAALYAASDPNRPRDETRPPRKKRPAGKRPAGQRKLAAKPGGRRGAARTGRPPRKGKRGKG